MIFEISFETKYLGHNMQYKYLNLISALFTAARNIVLCQRLLEINDNFAMFSSAMLYPPPPLLLLLPLVFVPFNSSPFASAARFTALLFNFRSRFTRRWMFLPSAKEPRTWLSRRWIETDVYCNFPGSLFPCLHFTNVVIVFHRCFTRCMLHCSGATHRSQGAVPGARITHLPIFNEQYISAKYSVTMN